MAVSLPTSLLEVHHDERPHSPDVADDLNKRRHRQLSSDNGTAKTRSRHHPIAMFGTLQSPDNEFRHCEGIKRSKDGRWHFLQPPLQETQIKNGILHELVRVPTSQKLLVRVSQHMRPARNCNKGRRTTLCSHNWPEHCYIVCSINCETVHNIHSNPMESALLPRSHEGPQWLATLLKFKAMEMMSLCPPNNPWQNSRQHSSNDNWLKAKQQCESEMRRRGSGNLRNIPKLRLVSRRLHASLAQWLAQTAPTVSRWDRSCLPSSTHLPGSTPSSGLATEGRSHQLRQRSSPLQTDALDPELQEDPFESSPSAAPAHLQSRDFLESPARATQVFQDANAGHVQSDDVPENAATFHGAHGWAGTYSFGTTDIKSGWAYSQHLMALSQKTCPAPLPRKPFSSGKFSSTELSGAPDLHLSRLCLFPTSQFSANSVRVPALAGPALDSALPTEKRKLWTDTILLNPKRRKIPTVHQRRQQLSLLFFAHGATQGHHLMPSGTNHSGSGIGHELICKRKKHGKNLEPTWSNTSKFLIRAQELPSPNAPSNSSLRRPWLWTASGTLCWDLPTNGTRLLVTTMWRPLNCPSVSTPVDTSSFPDTPESSRHHLEITQGMSHWYEKTCNVE